MKLFPGWLDNFIKITANVARKELSPVASFKFSVAPFKSVSETIRGTQGYAGRADKGTLSRLIYILRLTTAASYKEREKSRETRQINSRGGRAFALPRAGEIYQNSRQQ